LQKGNDRVTFPERVLGGFFQYQIQLRPNLTVSVGIRYYWQNYFRNVPHDFAPRLSLPGRRARRKRRSSAEDRASFTIVRGWFSANSFNPTGEWGLADLDQRHRLNVMGNLTAGKWLNFGLLFALILANLIRSRRVRTTTMMGSRMTDRLA
jgi:hypothetical protein